ncbi:hypothetical protein [Serratia fonticola]|uniref:hypothetical protein n=1 Tax=Serratia fonticola TaxID=47917 RepID=UPI0012682FF2|nr:hypothetical protein [Serratia fonticola]MEB7885390.1 hypothetical protein [Serratia fonticola]
MINTYFVPTLFSVLGYLSLSSYLSRVGGGLKIGISLLVSSFAILLYFFAHALSKGGDVPSFGIGELIAVLFISLINAVALWVFIKLKKE